MTSWTTLAIIHAILLAHYAYGIYAYVFELVVPPEVAVVRSGFGGPFKYLTFLNMLIQCVYFFIALINDIVGSNAREFRKACFIQRIRDFFFATVVFSVGSFVTVTFWTLWHINRDLIFPKIFDTFFPLWLNHNIHSTPLVGVLLELWLCPHSFPSQKKGFSVTFTLIIIYALWICFVAFKTGYWVYPILQKLTYIGKAAFICGMAILVHLFYIIGDALNSRIWIHSKKKMVKKAQ